jgi:hypothetical protein
MVIPNLPSIFFGATAQPLAAKQYHHNNDEENEADRAAANIKGAGKKR